MLRGCRATAARQVIRGIFMADDLHALRAKFHYKNRYATFGACLRSITVNGFRGIDALTIDFDFPVMALSGLNGAGKSTVGQLCLAAYKQPSTVSDKKRFYVRDFFPTSVADPAPFGAHSSVVYTYNTSDSAAPQALTVARATKEWSGYKRQPERSCYYIGFTIYIPKVEQRDLSVYRGAQVSLGQQRSIPDEVRQRVGRILGQPYAGLHFQGVDHGHRHGELGIATRYGSQYSENNMGFGEGRILYIVDLMENSPMQSLFVIEEPETSLHENAQHELANYFLDVCNRRFHQIVLTTHSSALLKRIPSEGRIMLARSDTGVSSFPGLSASRARSILSNGKERELDVLVEDDFARTMLIEMVRRVDRGLLNCIQITAAGDTKAVKAGLELLTMMRRPSCAVRDADIGSDPAMRLFSFPGSQAPEKEVFLQPEVQQKIRDKYGIDTAAILALSHGADHHHYSEILAVAANTTAVTLETNSIEWYLDTVGEEVFAPLVKQIGDAMR
jgi:predicted ATPase